MADMYTKGRGAPTEVRRADMLKRALRGDAHPFKKHPELVARGERAGASKVTAEIVREIRQRYRKGGIFQRELALEYGISREQVGGIVRGTEWRHIE